MGWHSRLRKLGRSFRRHPVLGTLFTGVLFLFAAGKPIMTAVGYYSWLVDNAAAVADWPKSVYFWWIALASFFAALIVATAVIVHQEEKSAAARAGHVEALAHQLAAPLNDLLNKYEARFSAMESFFVADAHIRAIQAVRSHADSMAEKITQRASNFKPIPGFGEHHSHRFFLGELDAWQKYVDGNIQQSGAFLTRGPISVEADEMANATPHWLENMPPAVKGPYLKWGAARTKFNNLCDEAIAIHVKSQANSREFVDCSGKSG